MKLPKAQADRMMKTNCHEVIQAFVDQSLFVSIWRHDDFEMSAWSYEVKQLPVGHYSPRETKDFTTEAPGEIGSIIESIDYGKTIKFAFYDNLTEPLMKLAVLIAKHDRES